MAYSKTTWVDNTTPINKDNLNKIEQGIYDNSLVVDAVTNTLNPTDTETYKTAELTEGQITDVIGVKDILIKGQTSQDGTPTPSAPVDVNVVSGSNVVNIENNKNLFDGIFRQGTHISSDAPNRIINKNILEAKIGKTYTLSTNLPSIYKWKITNNEKHEIADSVRTINDTTYSSTSSVTINCTENGYLRVMVGRVDDNNITPNDIVGYKFQVEQGSTATTYEPHQGKELPLDLPVENLMALANSTNTYNGITRVIENGVIKLNGTPQSTSYNNTILTFTATKTGQYMLLPYKSSTNSNIRFIYKINDGSFINNDDNLTMNLTKNDVVTINLRISSTDRINNFTLKPMLYLGTKVNAFYPYGTDSIELCKIGNYQDYFYKSGSKWYLHKEIGKVALEGDENWTADSNGQRAYSSVIANNVLRPTTNDIVLIGLCDKLPVLSFTDVYINKRDGLSISTSGILSVHIAGVTDIPFNENDFKIWISQLSNNNITLYYALATAIDTEITDTTLISQLEVIYNAPLYEQTNITQENNDLPMILDITACKDNINGIKAFIRK